VDLRILARESKVPLAVLQSSNRELNMTLTPPASYGYLLKVPVEFGDAVQSALSSDAIRLVDFRVHIVVAGDTLYGIARAFGVPQNLILDYNPGVKAQALKIGIRLLIPLVQKG
jgi:hypothetical protein